MLVAVPVLHRRRSVAQGRQGAVDGVLEGGEGRRVGRGPDEEDGGVGVAAEGALDGEAAQDLARGGGEGAVANLDARCMQRC